MTTFYFRYRLIVPAAQVGSSTLRIRVARPYSILRLMMGIQMLRWKSCSRGWAATDFSLNLLPWVTA